MALNNGSYDQGYSQPNKPPRRKNNGWAAALLLPAVALLLVTLMPSLRKKVMNEFSPPVQIKVEMGAQVWTNKKTGSYYCRGSMFYGHGPGKFMNQGDALTAGFQPEQGKYCTESQSSDAKTVTRKGSESVASMPASGEPEANSGARRNRERR